MLLSPQELRDLTDRARAADQIAWLRSRGWRFEVSATGRPKVAKAEYERRMVAGSQAKGKPRLEVVR